MSLTYLTTDELSGKIKYDSRTIRERMKDSVLIEGTHYKHGNIALAKMELMAEFNLHQKSVQFDNQYYGLAQIGLPEKLDLLVGLAAAKRTNLALFESILLDCGMNWLELYRQYVGKNVLNVFRQDHGYKAGTYIKIWNGREDNEHLVEILDMADLDAGDVCDSLYQSLKARYLLILK